MSETKYNKLVFRKDLQHRYQKTSVMLIFSKYKLLYLFGGIHQIIIKLSMLCCSILNAFEDELDKHWAPFRHWITDSD